VFGYPPDEAARVASQALSTFLLHEQGTAKLESIRRPVMEVRLVFFTMPAAETFLRHQQFPR
jgi:O-acetyl-ADP-ribose deacetylase (regulator of RNase III)